MALGRGLEAEPAVSGAMFDELCRADETSVRRSTVPPPSCAVALTCDCAMAHARRMQLICLGAIERLVVALQCQAAADATGPESVLRVAQGWLLRFVAERDALLGERHLGRFCRVIQALLSIPLSFVATATSDAPAPPHATDDNGSSSDDIEEFLGDRGSDDDADGHTEHRAGRLRRHGPRLCGTEYAEFVHQRTGVLSSHLAQIDPALLVYVVDSLGALVAASSTSRTDDGGGMDDAAQLRAYFVLLLGARLRVGGCLMAIRPLLPSMPWLSTMQQQWTYFRPFCAARDPRLALYVVGARTPYGAGGVS